MGKKGDRMTTASTAVAESIVERLGPLGAVTGKKMFGGYGVFEAGTMFAIVDSRGQFFDRSPVHSEHFVADKLFESGFGAEHVDAFAEPIEGERDVPGSV